MVGPPHNASSTHTGAADGCDAARSLPAAWQALTSADARQAVSWRRRAAHSRRRTAAAAAAAAQTSVLGWSVLGKLALAWILLNHLLKFHGFLWRSPARLRALGPTLSACAGCAFVIGAALAAAIARIANDSRLLASLFGRNPAESQRRAVAVGGLRAQLKCCRFSAPKQRTFAVTPGRMYLLTSASAAGQARPPSTGAHIDDHMVYTACMVLLSFGSAWII